MFNLSEPRFLKENCSLKTHSLIPDEPEGSSLLRLGLKNYSLISLSTLDESFAKRSKLIDGLNVPFETC